MRTKTWNIRLSDQDWERLRALAEWCETAASQIVRTLIKERYEHEAAKRNVKPAKRGK